MDTKNLRYVEELLQYEGKDFPRTKPPTDSIFRCDEPDLLRRRRDLTSSIDDTNLPIPCLISANKNSPDRLHFRCWTGVTCTSLPTQATTCFPKRGGLTSDAIHFLFPSLLVSSPTITIASSFRSFVHSFIHSPLFLVNQTCSCAQRTTLHGRPARITSTLH
jgi:hypothetical protein